MTAAQVTTPRHPFELLFQQLSGAMGIVHELGPVAGGVDGQPNRIVWTLGASQIVKRGYRKQGADFVGFLAVDLGVEIYGGSPLEVTMRHADLASWLDTIVGPEQGAADAGDGYKLGKSTPIVVGDGTSTGASCKVPVTLYLGVWRQVWGSHTVGSVPIAVLALNTFTDTPTGDANNPIEASA